MAKYAENVNKQSKIIDIQKQFPGGLKTVDTDDALGKVYLREAENVSLSEFSFLEKRYGLSEEEVYDILPNIDKIQGYFEYTAENGLVDKILFADGKAYIKQGNGPFQEQDGFYTEDGFQYPDLSGVFDDAPLGVELEQDFTISFGANAALVSSTGEIAIGFIADLIVISATAALVFDPDTSVTAFIQSVDAGSVTAIVAEASGTKQENVLATQMPSIFNITIDYIAGTGTYDVSFIVANQDDDPVTLDYGIENISDQTENDVSTFVSFNETVALTFGQTYEAYASAEANGKSVSGTAREDIIIPAGSTWTSIGTTSQATDDNFNLHNDFSYSISSSCQQASFMGSFLPSASNYPKGAVVRISSYENSQGFPMICLDQYYRAD